MEKTMKIKSIQVRELNEYKKPRIYFFIEDETIFDNLMNRRSRPYDEYRKLLPKVFKKAGIKADTKARWSQRAGCSCGCSPAFIVDIGHDQFHLEGTEVFVDLV